MRPVRVCQVVLFVQCVAVCCSVLQCVAVCCSVLQWYDVCYSVLQLERVCQVAVHNAHDLFRSNVQSACACVLVCVCLSLSLFLSLSFSLSFSLSLFLSLSLPLFVYMCICVCIHVYMCVKVHAIVCVCVCLCGCGCVCVCVNIYICVYMYVYTSCIDHSTSEAGSIIDSACTCNQGYTGADGDLCSPCEVGTFKTAQGSADCSMCPANSLSLAGSSINTECICIAGWTGVHGGTCSQCATGKYSEATGGGVSTDCVLCPQGKYQTDAAMSECVDCVSGKYLDSDGNDAETDCVACMTNSGSSPAGSSHVSACRCNAGSAGPNGGPVCTLCVPGKHQADTGSTECVDCDAGKYLSTAGGTADTDCATCDSDLVSEAGSVQCVSCPVYSESTGGIAPTCACSVRFTRVGPDCELCTDDTVKIACSDCPGASTDPTAQICQPSPTSDPEDPVIEILVNISDLPDVACSLAMCGCRAGYTGALIQCIPCEADTYKEDIGSATCASCPSSSSRPSASSNCTCDPGHNGPDGGPCIACPEGYYQDVPGASVCQPCHDFSTSLAGSTLHTNCTCIEGYKGTPGGPCGLVCPPGSQSVSLSQTCEECPANTYKQDSGDHGCVPCPSFMQHSLTGQTDISVCACQAGYLYNAISQLCENCPPGTFNNKINDTKCFICLSTDNIPDTSGLTQWFKFNTDYDLLHDSSVSNRDGTWTNANINDVTFNEGDGSLQIELTTSVIFEAQIHLDISMLIWVRWDVETPNTNSHVVHMGRSWTTGAFFTISRLADKRLAFTMSNGRFRIHNTIKTFENGRWFHIVWILDRTTFTWIIYIDRVEFSLSQFSVERSHDAYVFPPILTFTDCRFGMRGDGGWLSDDRFIGNVDDFRVYDRVLSAAEVFAAYHQKALNIASDGVSCPNLTSAVAGYEVTDSGENLVECMVNHYQDGSGIVCTQCQAPDTYTARGGLVSIMECECAAYYVLVNGVCMLCAVGSYQSANDGGCTLCPDNSTTLAASSTSISQCVCVVDFELVSGVCSPCQASAFKYNHGNDACINCGTGAALRPDEPHTPNACECQAGYIGPRNACSACPEGSYTTGPGATQCVSCPMHATTSEAASTNISECFCPPPLWEAAATGVCLSSCAAGQHGAASSCAPCAAGSYKEAQGPQACTPCPPPRDSSRPGSVLVTSCSCPAGRMVDPTGGKYAIVGSVGALPTLADFETNGAFIGNIVAQVDNCLAGCVQEADAGMRLHSIRLVLVAGVVMRDVTVSVSTGGTTLVLYMCTSDCVSPIDLYGSRGRLDLRAPNELEFTIYRHIRRPVVLASNAGNHVSQATAELFAMEWGLRPGGTVFAGLVSLSQADPACLLCAQGLVCASYI